MRELLSLDFTYSLPRLGGGISHYKSIFYKILQQIQSQEIAACDWICCVDKNLSLAPCSR